jgi:shikimate kinase
METKLCPAQHRAWEELLAGLPVGHVFVLSGPIGMGKTTILREVQRTCGGAFLTMKDLVDAMQSRHPLALEETLEQLLMGAVKAHELVILDDLHLLENVVGSCNSYFYPRREFVNAPLMALTTYAAAAGKKLIFGTTGGCPSPVQQRSYFSAIKEFKVADYRFLCHTYLDAAVAGRLDYDKIYRFAPKLNAHQLKAACAWLRRDAALSTDGFIDYLRSRQLASNVDLVEVQQVALHELKGIDDVIQSLEANIILPLEDDALAAELGLKPKRGVLLAGPPGTGKTTVGRALAHRLQSKFFLIDGTVISGTQAFYARIQHLFEVAKQNAPSIIFIDDSDIIFESHEEFGLYRYLLTMLDGLESHSAGRVCVMLTAMDVGCLPPALIRSGRVELWLEMRLPDEAARAAILGQHLAALPPAFAAVDRASLAAATEGFTGADLKGLIEDGKTLFAFDKARQRPLRPLTEYFLEAVATVRANKERYAQAEARARQQRAARPPYFELLGSMMTEDGAGG